MLVFNLFFYEERIDGWNSRVGITEQGKTKKCQRVNTRREDAVRPSSFNQSMRLFNTSICRPSVFKKKIKIYFKINKYGHLTLKNISFYEIDDFSFLYFFEKKKSTGTCWQTALGRQLCGIFVWWNHYLLTWNTFIFTSRCNYYKCSLILL